MSIALMTVAWALPVASTDKLVLLALADNANDAGCCWPSMATIARKCGLSERATRLAMRRLEAAGHVSSVDRTGTSRLYTVHPGTSCPPAPDDPRHDVPVTPAPRAPKPSRTTISSTKTTSSPKKRARSAEPFALPSWVPADAWEGWLEMRRTKGARETARAMSLAVGELKKLADAGQLFDSKDYELWPEALVDEALASPDPSIRLSVALLYYTAQRIGDVCKMRWSDVRDDYVAVKQEKTKKDSGQSLQMIEHYAKRRSGRKLSTAAIHKLERAKA